MKRNVILALAVVAVALSMVGGAVLAKTITCTGGPCNGTKRADQITGSFAADTINARGGNDTIDGDLGNDTISGGGGGDTIIDNLDTVPDIDTINGGKGNDIIDVREGDLNDEQDTVDCGPGTDTIFFDATDLRANCEIFNPI
jgi:Ca2+-binding RTX toxin-like protein